MLEEETGFKKEAFSDRAGLLAFLFFVAILVAVAVVFVDKLRGDARRVLSINNMRQLGLSCHNHESAHGFLPSASHPRSDQEKSHGWQIKIMPFVESNPLYAMVDPRCDWDHSINAPIFQMAIPTFQSPHSEYVYDGEGSALTHYCAMSKAIPLGKPKRLEDLDGNTQMIGEIAAGFPSWGKPGNTRSMDNGVWFDEKSFGNPEYDGYAYVNVDGSTHYWTLDRPRPRKLDPSLYRVAQAVNPASISVDHLHCEAAFNHASSKWNVWFMQTKKRGPLIDDPGFVRFAEANSDTVGVLILRDSEMTTGGLKEISRFKSLETLLIRQMVLDTEIWNSIGQIGGLKNLILYGCDVNYEDVQSFQDTMPGCELVIARDQPIGE